MKTFFKMFLAVVLGLIVTPIIMFFIVLIIGLAALSTDKAPVISPKSVLHLDLNCTITERVADNPFENYDFSFMEQEKTIGLNTLSSILRQAKEDDNIEGIYLEVTKIAASLATIEELRNHLLDFKESGKFVYCYSDYFSQSAYYLASASDKVFLHPQGTLDLRGLAANVMFFKKLLEKVDLEMQIVRHGTYKSAVEPFMFDKMSEANREQVQTYLNSMWNHIVANISKSRSLDVKSIQNICDSILFIASVDEATGRGIVDELAYKDQFETFLHAKLDLDSAKKINYVSTKSYKKTLPLQKAKSDKIAVIYAVGTIGLDKGNNQSIGFSTAEEMAKAREDKNVKAVVFRVNSGGGSVLTSESIWREVYLTRQVKPVVVSMGDYAASGGYYIACASDYIVAQPTTITGSIGVFGTIPNMEKMLANKLGITIDRVKTNKYSDAISATRSMDNYERNALQNMVEKVYATFIKRVADGREMTTSYVDSIGQGRVWSGIDALNLRLVDTLGGLDVAIAKAAEFADISDYAISERPAMKDFFQEFTESFMDARISTRMQKSNLHKTYSYFQFVESALELKGVQARIPYIIEIY